MPNDIDQKVASDKDQKGHKPVKFQIQIERVHYTVTQQLMTGAELRRVPPTPIPADRDLFEVVPGAPDRKIGASDTGARTCAPNGTRLGILRRRAAVRVEGVALPLSVGGRGIDAAVGQRADAARRDGLLDGGVADSPMPGVRPDADAHVFPLAASNRQPLHGPVASEGVPS